MIPLSHDHQTNDTNQLQSILKHTKGENTFLHQGTKHNSQNGHPHSPATNVHNSGIRTAIAQVACRARNLERRLIHAHLSRSKRAIPAIPLKARTTATRHRGARARKTATQCRARHARRPLTIQGAIRLGAGALAVGDDGVALRDVVARREGRDVAGGGVGRVGYVHDERRGRLVGCGEGEVGGVAAEEGGAVVEAEVDEGVGVGDG